MSWTSTTRSYIEHIMLGVAPEPITASHHLLVLINGVLYPPKQVRTLASGDLKSDYKTNSATPHLEKLGFPHFTLTPGW